MKKHLNEVHLSDSPPWGILACIDLYKCDPNIIRDAQKIRQFVVELCDLIEMKRFGETQVIHFGEDERVAGFSMTQLIETSLISAHFAKGFFQSRACPYTDGPGKMTLRLPNKQEQFTYSLSQSFIKPKARVIQYDGESLKEVEEEERLKDFGIRSSNVRKTGTHSS